MAKLNLLPHHIEARKKTRKIKLMMLVTQAAIFLCIGLTLLLLRNLEQNITVRAGHFNFEFNENHAQAAIELEEARARSRHFDVFYLENFSVDFNVVWFSAIINSLPQSANISQLSYNQSEILFLGGITDTADIEIHRQGLLDTDLFNYVRLGRVHLLENGMFSYELRIGISPYGE